MRLLIVEDEPDVALVIEDVALATGFEVVGIASRASEALELAAEAEVAIVDVRLADGLTGPEIARALVSGFNVGVAYLTGNPELIKNYEGIHITSKPPTVETIKEALITAAKWRTRRVESLRQKSL